LAVFFCATLTGCKGDIKNFDVDRLSESSVSQISYVASSTDSDEETTQRQPAKFCLNRKLDACQVSPAITHGIPKKQRKNHAKQ